MNLVPFSTRVLLLLALLTLTPFGCRSVARTSFRVDTIKAEIPRKPPEVVATGMWESPEWDPANLTQKDADISGRMGDFKIDGLVTGKEVFLFLLYGDQPQYTMKLTEPSPGTLAGDWFRGLPHFEDMAPGTIVPRSPILLRRVPGTSPPK